LPRPQRSQAGILLAVGASRIVLSHSVTPQLSAPPLRGIGGAKSTRQGLFSSLSATPGSSCTTQPAPSAVSLCRLTTISQSRSQRPTAILRLVRWSWSCAGTAHSSPQSLSCHGVVKRQMGRDLFARPARIRGRPQCLGCSASVPAPSPFSLQPYRTPMTKHKIALPCVDVNGRKRWKVPS
jgi:hypothetical protein